MTSFLGIPNLTVPSIYHTPNSVSSSSIGLFAVLISSRITMHQPHWRNMLSRNMRRRARSCVCPRSPHSMLSMPQAGISSERDTGLAIASLMFFSSSKLMTSNRGFVFTKNQQDILASCTRVLTEKGSKLLTDDTLCFSPSSRWLLGLEFALFSNTMPRRTGCGNPFQMCVEHSLRACAWWF